MTPTVTQVHGDSRSLTSLPENRLQTCSQHRWDLSTLESPLPHLSVLLPHAKNTSAPLSLKFKSVVGTRSHFPGDAVIRGDLRNN